MEVLTMTHQEEELMVKAMFAETEQERVLQLLRIIESQRSTIEFLGELVNWDDDEEDEI